MHGSWNRCRRNHTTIECVNSCKKIKILSVRNYEKYSSLSDYFIKFVKN